MSRPSKPARTRDPVHVLAPVTASPQETLRDSSTFAVTGAPDPHFDRLRRWSVLLDRAFRIPGTQIRFGWDPIIGLIPGLGDISSPLFAAFILVQARRMRVPRVVQARMLINAMVDAALGFVPVLGNIADIGWRANVWNMRLLERHAAPGLPPRRGDKIFVWTVLLLLAAVTVLPIALLFWLLSRVSLF